MNRAPDDATRLLALLVAICGPEISVYRTKIEALVATLNANSRFVKTGAPIPATDVVAGNAGADRT
jgi:hypothetical protein